LVNFVPVIRPGFDSLCGMLDAHRQVESNNRSVLTVRDISAAGVLLRNAQGRERLVKWDTLRDRSNGVIPSTYGDLLTIDATRGHCDVNFE
jgi:hypothetical protein